MASPLSGIFTPNITPLDKQGRVDEDMLCSYVDWLIEKGVDGLYPNGSTGEFTRFTAEERRRIVKVLADHVRGRVPILAGAAEANVQETIAACNAYGDMGVAAVAIVAPFYYKLSPEAVYQYFKEIADSARVPVTLYNIPLFASPIDVQTVTRLAMDCPQIVGIKDSSGDLPNMMRMMAAIRPQRPDFCFLTGWEAALAPMLIAGCDGGTNATSGIVPELTGAIYRAVRDGQWQQAIKLQYQLIPLFDAMISCAEFPEGFRRGVKVRGWDMGISRQPLSPSQLQAADAAQQIIAKQLSVMPQVDLHGVALSREKVAALSQDANLIDRIVQQIMSELQKR